MLFNLNTSHSSFRLIDILARRRVLSITLVGILSFGGSWLFSTFRGMPVPLVDDEFSYLLAGDTFAHGRITNPTHPLWESFETFNVLQRPTYMSMHQPGQGIFLALGQVVFGRPIFGVWLSAGLMCAAICWMLYAWVPPRWALIGGLVAVLQFGIFTYWSQSYWGGAVAGIGGALVFGALPRIIKYQRLRDTLFLGLGIGILVNTRPLEGVLFGIPLGCMVLPWKIKWQSLDKRLLIKNVVLPFILLILAIAALTGTYNKKITGNAWEFPHVLVSKLSLVVPVCIWQPLYPQVHYNHKVWTDYFRNWYNWYIIYYHDKRTWKGFTQDMFGDSVKMYTFFLGFPLALPSLPIMMQLFCSRKTAGRYFISLCIILFLFGMITYRVKAYFIASLTCFAVLLITIGLRGFFWLNFRQKQIGPTLIICLISLQLLLNIIFTPQQVVVSLARNIQSSSVIPAKAGIFNRIDLPPSFTREELKNILMKRGGKYLVIVKYPLWHNYFWEWVHNDADIDHSPIVWAREMDEEHHKKLLEYFKDRQVLFIDVCWDMPDFFRYDARQ